MLLDTHVVLWWLRRDVGRLSAELVERLGRPDAVIVVSAVVIWELAIKRSIGKLSGLPTDLPGVLRSAGVELMAITARHAEHAMTLPLHHRDPFDRLLVAQAQLELLPIATLDAAIERYAVETIR